MHHQTRLTILQSAPQQRQFLNEQLNGPAVKNAAAKFKLYKPNPTPRDGVVAIDGSNAVAAKHGFTFGVSTVVAVKSDGTTKYVKTISGFDLDSNSERMILEAKCVEVMVKEFDTIVDGSLYNLIQFAKSNKYIQRIVDPKNQLIFISKTSTCRRQQFGPLTDMAYYSQASVLPGYSEPLVDVLSQSKIITSSYCRLSKNAPLIKIEIFGKTNSQKIEKIMDLLCAKMIGGYPYELILAHNECKISNEDLLEIESVLGISAIMDERNVLHE